MEKRSVLFVDDDPIILRSFERSFQNKPYNQLFTKSGREALEILQKEEVHVIVTDMCMPGMDGLELLKIVREKYPRIVQIIISGYTDMPVLHKKVKHKEIFRFIYKPWKLDRAIFEPWKLEIDLKKTVQQALDHYNLQNECETVR
ncbi:MAG: response regulator [Planctomycetes bacterium]|nr:response regulator [Planctomycetota bacterium]